MTNRVFVLDMYRNPLMPCQPARARKLLDAGRAAVIRHQPFTIVLKDREDGETQPTQIKIDPGSKITGLALVSEFEQRGKVVIWAGELHHRGWQISKRLADRRTLRRGRRSRKTRYRKPRFLNRKRSEGWLPPSVQHRVDTTVSWINRLSRFSYVTGISLESVKFDTQLLQDPNISGKEYQQGTLFGYELREYLLQRHQHTCAYCEGLSNDSILEREHVVPKSRGGSNRLDNQVIACRTCNVEKNHLTAEEWASNLKPKSRLNKKRIEKANRIAEGQRPALKDAAAVNAIRNQLHQKIQLMGLPFEVGTGGQTKYNRTRQGYGKKHWIDAACVGESGISISLDSEMSCLKIESKGYGMRQRAITDKYGFPKLYRPRQKYFKGVKIGSLVKVTEGKWKGFVGNACKTNSSLSIANSKQRISAVPRKVQVIQQPDGYTYG